MRWTRVKDYRLFLAGLVQSADRSGVRYSLHREGRQGWVMARFGGHAEVYGPVLYDRAKSTYNSLLSR